MFPVPKTWCSSLYIVACGITNRSAPTKHTWIVINRLLGQISTLVCRVVLKTMENSDWSTVPWTLLDTVCWGPFKMITASNVKWNRNCLLMKSCLLNCQSLLVANKSSYFSENFTYQTYLVCLYALGYLLEVEVNLSFVESHFLHNDLALFGYSHSFVLLVYFGSPQSQSFSVISA